MSLEFLPPPMAAETLDLHSKEQIIPCFSMLSEPQPRRTLEGPYGRYKPSTWRMTQVVYKVPSEIKPAFVHLHIGPVSYVCSGVSAIET